MVKKLELTKRFGDVIENPSPEDLRIAAHEVCHEDLSKLTEEDYAEHPNAWLSLGFQNGDKWTVCTLDFYRNHRMIFSRLEDQDDDEPAFEHARSGVSEAEALRLWLLLASGELPRLMEESWD